MFRNASRSVVRNGLCRRGYSLVDVTLTVLILGVLASVAIPRFTSALDDYRGESAVQRLVTDLQWARRHARATGTAETVTFDTTAGCYAFSSIRDPNRADQMYSVRLADSPWLARISRVTFDDSQALTFDGFGFPQSSGKIELSVGGTVRVVTVDGSTGVVADGRVAENGGA